MTLLKETDRAPISVHKETKINELSEKEFRIVLSKKFSEPQKWWLYKVRKIMHEQNEKFNKGKETINKAKQILELKNKQTQ